MPSPGGTCPVMRRMCSSARIGQGQIGRPASIHASQNRPLRRFLPRTSDLVSLKLVARLSFPLSAASSMFWPAVSLTVRSTAQTSSFFMLNLLHAKTFLTVLGERGFRAAARELKLSPSTIVEHINQLEADLAAPLIVRRRGAVEPTSQGAAFVPLARALLDTAERSRILDLQRAAARGGVEQYRNIPVAISACFVSSERSLFRRPLDRCQSHRR